MSITDELREWAHGPDEGDDWLDRIDEFCDRIDREHRMAMEKVAAEVDEEDRAECYIALPVDADGEPIHMGDVVRYDNLGNKGEPFEVKEITYRMGCEDEVGDGEQYGTIIAMTVRHHHAPTVEDVLREFAEKIIDSQIPNVHPTYEEAIAEYAAKLRLAEEVE